MRRGPRGIAGCAVTVLTVVGSASASVPKPAAQAPPAGVQDAGPGFRVMSFQGRPKSALVKWLGAPVKIKRLADGLLLYVWLDSPYGLGTSGYPEGLRAGAGFFVRPDGTVIGPACRMEGIRPTTVEELMAIIGSPSRVESSEVFGVSYYVWKPTSRKSVQATGTKPLKVLTRFSAGADAQGRIFCWDYRL
jgi:hypothetical protein